MNGRIPLLPVACAIVLAAGLAIGLLLGYNSAPQPTLRDLPIVGEDQGTAASRQEMPAALLAAADEIEARMAPGGGGLAFTVASEVRLIALPGGSPVPAPAEDPSASPAAERWQRGVLGEGFVSHDGFTAEWREAPDETVRDFASATVNRAVLERDGGRWERYPGAAGWQPVDRQVLGFGIDSVSAARLPGLLRDLIDVRELGTDAAGLTGYAGLADRDGWPGVIVSDGRDLTASPIAVEAWLDGDRRLVRVIGSARNINEPRYDLRTVVAVDLRREAIDLPPAPTAPSPATSPDAPAASPEAVP